jgi:hypothetical protein
MNTIFKITITIKAKDCNKMSIYDNNFNRFLRSILPRQSSIFVFTAAKVQDKYIENGS